MPRGRNRSYQYTLTFDKGDLAMTRKAVYQHAAPYLKDAMNLPVKSVNEALPFYEKTMGFQRFDKTDSSVFDSRRDPNRTCGKRRRPNSGGVLFSSRRRRKSLWGTEIQRAIDRSELPCRHAWRAPIQGLFCRGTRWIMLLLRRATSWLSGASISTSSGG